MKHPNPYNLQAQIDAALAEPAPITPERQRYLDACADAESGPQSWRDAPTANLDPQHALTLTPGSKSRNAADIPEKAVEEVVDAWLKWAGYRVLVTSEKRRAVRCEKCREWFTPHGPTYGITRGVPDRLVRRDSWPLGCWYLVELKGSHTEASPEQKEISAAGGYLIVRPHGVVEDAVRQVSEALAAFEALRL
jgi:hypothetical protein